MNTSASVTETQQILRIENQFVRLRDGTRIAVGLWIPDGPPVPAILNVSPYGKKDMNAAGDEALFGYFAGHGFAGVRADMRGNGESTGTLHNMAAQPEWDDVCELLEWIESRDWCDGNIGMWGFSWGGIEAFSTAAFRNPPQLKTIVAGGFSTDKYRDGPFYMGGVLLRDTMGWLTSFLGMRSRAPDPDAVGDGWLEEWRTRIDTLEPIFDQFLAHPVRDDFWARDSTADLTDRVRCPMLLWSGLLEAPMTNSEVGILGHTSVPTHLIVGPWAHKRPYEGRPGPAIGFLQEVVRWYDLWLRGGREGVVDTPRVRLWLPDGTPPASFFDESHGRWLAFDDWPAASRDVETHFLDSGTLAASPPGRQVLTHRSVQHLGLAGGERMPYLAFAPSAELPDDQQIDDSLSLSFDGAPVEEAVDIVGRPELTLELAVDQSDAFVCARLCDVWPDGRSTRISLGMLNMMLREGLDVPTAIVPGTRYRIAIQFDFASYVLQPGHRLRVALSNTYWPLCWPSPSPVTMQVHCGASKLALPVLRQPRDANPWTFQSPETAPPLRVERIGAGWRRDWDERDEVTGKTSSVTEEHGDARLTDRGLSFGATRRQSLAIVDNQPLSACHNVRVERRTSRANWCVRTETTSCMTASKEAFAIELSVNGFHDEAVIAEKSWSLSIPRLHA